jgi:hypothetical protein
MLPDEKTNVRERASYWMKRLRLNSHQMKRPKRKY